MDLGGLETGGQARNIVAEVQFNERVRTFREFLDNDYGDNVYKQKIAAMIASEKRRLHVSINQIRNFNREYAEGLLNSPIDYLPAFDKAVRDVVSSLPTYVPDPTGMDQSYAVGLEGSFGENFVSPRSLSSSFLGKMICIEGIVTRCSLVRPKVVRSVHYCEKTETFHAREYRDQTHLGHQLPTGSVYPKEDDNGNPLTTEFGLCTYRGTQTISIQEMPERAPAGQLPHPVDVILDHDLADNVKPGDRVQIVGVYRTLGKHAITSSAVFKTLILANSVKQLGKTINRFNITDGDIKNIEHLAKKKNIFDLLSASLAPSIYGHEYIKKAVLLQMLGGVEKNLENGTHIRGDINILMIGDPSTAKSQMLRFILNIAPLAIATTGRGSSGVGLTAAVTSDKDTGERRLEAGAMVLADRGVVCIDEFDKMSDIDRVAIHEVMEQQTVTIAKAGIHTSLNARCSVIAAANPVMGQYVDTKEPSKNINLPDSLLSRFDLLFVVLDNMEDEHNRAIAEHVVRLHRYTPAGLEEGAPIDENTFDSCNTYTNANDENTEEGETEVFEKFNSMLHIGFAPKKSRSRKSVGQDRAELISIPFIRKYIQYAKHNIKPIMTEQAADLISRQYSELRAWEDGRERLYRVMPITARTLETLIRLSTAHAKARLSSSVEESDVEVAMEILEYALYKEVKGRRVKRRKVEEEMELETDTDESEAEYGNKKTKPKRAPKQKDQDEEMADQETVADSQAMSGTSQDVSNAQVLDRVGQVTLDDVASGSLLTLDSPRMKYFEQRLNEARRQHVAAGGHTEVMNATDSLERINDGLSVNNRFELSEFEKCLELMGEANLLWYRKEASEIMFF